MILAKMQELITQLISLLTKDLMIKVFLWFSSLLSLRSWKTLDLRLFYFKEEQTVFQEIDWVVSIYQSEDMALQLNSLKNSTFLSYSSEEEDILSEMSLVVGLMKLLLFVEYKFQMKFLKTNTAFTLLLNTKFTCLWVICRIKTVKPIWVKQLNKLWEIWIK